MRLGILFSGGKDSTYAAWLAKKEGHNLCCFISLWSENKDSFMFHTPAIELTKKQATLAGMNFISRKTQGNKELELRDLTAAIKLAIRKYQIQGIVTGAVESVYQASRIQKICEELKIECFNPLWQKDQIELLNDLVKNKFQVVISGVAAYPLDAKWIGKPIDNNFIQQITELKNKYNINPAGEGGEFESLVINCPLFKKKLDYKIVDFKGEKNSWRGEFK